MITTAMCPDCRGEGRICCGMPFARPVPVGKNGDTDVEYECCQEGIDCPNSECVNGRVPINVDEAGNPLP